MSAPDAGFEEPVPAEVLAVIGPRPAANDPGRQLWDANFAILTRPTLAEMLTDPAYQDDLEWD